MLFDSDEELLASTDAEPAAFGRFYARHERAVLRFFMVRTRDAETSADLCAETFAAALRSRNRYRNDRGPAVAWLFGIARHQLAQHHRSGVVEQRARRRLGLLGFRASAEELDGIESLESDISAELLLQELPDDQAAAIRARVLQDKSYAEIAALGAVSEATVRQRVSRGIATLRLRAKESPWV